MNDQLLKQLVRQMKILNFWVSIFGGLFLIALFIVAFLIWQMVSFAHQTNQKIDWLKNSAADSLNVKKQTCEGDNDFSEWVQTNTKACD